jgi:hypothetical protein
MNLKLQHLFLAILFGFGIILYGFKSDKTDANVSSNSGTQEYVKEKLRYKTHAEKWNEALPIDRIVN